MDHRDRVVIVTGASSGIGSVTAEAFARRGAIVVAVARREPQLRELVERLRVHSPRSEYLRGDLGERAFAEQVVDRSFERFGRIDVLVNNAAIPKHKRIYGLSAEEAEQVMRVNFLSCVWTTLAAIPYMLRAGGGTVVNISSFAARVAPPREAIYAASKAAMNSFSEGLWSDLAGSDIHVAVINPGPIDTGIWLGAEEPNAYRGRKHPPEMVAEAVLDAVERRIFERTVPPRSLPLLAARALRLLAPSLLRRGMARMDPVPRETIDRARERARRGKRLGEPG